MGLKNQIFFESWKKNFRLELLLKSHKVSIVVLRIFGLFLLYSFFEEAVRVINIITGADAHKGVSAETFGLHGVVDLLAGTYLFFFAGKIFRKYLKDAFIVAIDDPTNETEANYLFALSIKTLGLYFFYQFLQNLVTAYNVASGNWSPGDRTASGFVIQAVFHFVLSALFIFKTSSIIEIVCKGSKRP